MAGPHPHAHLHAHHKPKHLEYHHVTIDATGTKSYGTPSQYEHAVPHQLRSMHHSRTGQAVFHEFEKRSHHFMKIIPYEQAQINAFASAKDPLHATRKGQSERSGADGHVLLDAHGKPIIGKGGGSDSDVSYTPVMWRKYSNQHKNGHKSGAQPDEILFHEMVPPGKCAASLIRCRSASCMTPRKSSPPFCWPTSTPRKRGGPSIFARTTM